MPRRVIEHVSTVEGPDALGNLVEVDHVFARPGELTPGDLAAIYPGRWSAVPLPGLGMVLLKRVTVVREPAAGLVEAEPDAPHGGVG